MKKTFKVNFRRDASWMSRMSRLSCVISLAFACALQAATVHKAPLKGLLIDNASVVTDVTGLGSATRLETADGRTWIDAAGDVHQAQRKAVFNGMEAVSGDDPSGTVEWMFYDDGPECGYCQMIYYAGRWDLALERLEDVDVDENGDVRQEMVQRTWSANAPWNSSTVTLNGDWGTETVQLSFVTGIVNRIAFTNDVPKIDFSKIPTLTTNDVCNIVTNEVAVIGDWVVTTNGAYAPGWRIDIWEFSVDDTPVFDVSLFDHEGSQIVILDTIGTPDPTATCYSGTIMEDVGGYGYVGIAYTAERKRITRNALGLARLEDLEGISGSVPSSVTNDIEKLKTESTLIYRLFSGSNIVMEVTNYNSRVNPPAMKLMRLDDKGIYEVMWTETNGLERTYNRAASNTAEQVAALDRKAAETYAPRGWSATTSGLGADAPKDTTWISTPTTVIAGGLEYSKVVTSSGQLWFLRSNGMVANVGGNSGGYFDISASDGTSVFLIEKTDSYMAPVDADGISVNGNTVTIRLSVVSADHPFLRYAPTLNTPVAWQREEDGFSSPIAVTWSGSSGAWVAIVTTTAKEGFFQFEFFQEGGTKIKSGGAMDVSTGGILCTDGIHKCRPVYNSNGTITWEAF